MAILKASVGAAEGIEVVRRHEEGIPQRDFGGAGDIAVVVNALGVPRDDRVPEAEGGAGELDRDRRVDLRFVACVRVNAIADELRQELGVGDVCEFRRDDGARFLVKLVSAPVRMRVMQAVDLPIVLAHE